MPALLIAIGNSLRGDDGVAHRVLELIGPAATVTQRSVMQLTPELAGEFASAGTVIFIDADINAREPYFERLSAHSANGIPLAHFLTPAELLCLATAIYHFRGDAFLCHVPAAVFGHNEVLSSRAETAAHRAADLIWDLTRT